MREQNLPLPPLIRGEMEGGYKWEGDRMTTKKQEIIDLIQTLPDTADYDEIMEKIYFKQSVENSLKQIDQGKTISHDEAKERLAKWIK
ncbi:MAG: hypothetical protein ACP5I1_12960 [Candidatus Hinthialibacter sp.]